MATFRGETQLNAGVVKSEDARENFSGEPRRDRPGIGLSKLSRQLLAVRERDRCLVLGMQQQTILREKAGEQKTMPLLIRALPDQQATVAAELSPLRSQPVAKARLLRVEMLRATVGEHAEAFDRVAGGALSRAAGSEHRRLELLAERGG